MSEDFPRASGSFAAGSQIAGYLLEEQIGQGGMAVVFRAHDERLDRTVALKILAPALADDDAFRQRFIRESRAAAAVDDPHIIPVYEAGEASGVLFIAMRFVRGGDVGTLVRRLGSLPPARMAGIVSQVASALDAAHARGLVHRDVKPTNMLLDANSGAGRPDHVYLSDFGLSKTSLQVSGLTATGQFLGTLEYVAPEQIESKPVDGRADQYALACATYELLAGAPPFQRNTAMAVIFAQLSDPPPPLTGLRPDLPGKLDSVLAKALAKAPENRYRTCTGFAEALRSACGLRPYDTGPGAAPRPERSATSVAVPSGWAETVEGTGGTEVAAPIAPAPVSAPPGTPPDGTVVAAPSRPPVTPVRSPVTPAPVAVRPRGMVVTPPASPAPTERLTAGPPAGPPRRRTALMASAVTLVVVAAAVVVIKEVTGGHSGTGPRKGHSSSTHVVTSNCARSAANAPANPGFGGYRHGPTLTDTGNGQVVVEGAAFSPDSSMLAVGDHNGVTYLWNTSSATQVTTLSDPTGSGVQAVAFSCTGKSVAVSDAGGATVVWNIASASAPSSTFPEPDGAQVVYGVALSPDGATLATGDSNGNAYLRTLKTGHTITLSNPGGPGNKVQAVAFSPNGATLATGDSNGTTYLWNTATGQPLGNPLQDSSPGGNGVQAVAFSPDGAAVAAGDSDGVTYLWNTSNGSSVATLTDANHGGDGVVAVAYSPDGGTLATGDSNGDTYLWNTATDQNARTLTGPSSGGFGVQALAFSPNGQMLAVGDVNGSTYLWQR